MTPWFFSKVQPMYTLDKLTKRNDIQFFFHYDSGSWPWLHIKTARGVHEKLYVWDLPWTNEAGISKGLELKYPRFLEKFPG